MRKDMRRALRYSVANVDLWLKEAAHEDDVRVPFRIVGSIADFSFSGLGVQAKEALPENEEVILRLGQGPKRSHALGCVVRSATLSRGGYRVGIELDAADNHFIARLVGRYLGVGYGQE